MDIRWEKKIDKNLEQEKLTKSKTKVENPAKLVIKPQ